MEYEGQICRSPMERGSFMLPVSVGCAYNRCRFCMLFKHLQYRTLPLEQIQAELDRVAALGGSPRRVFLGDGKSYVAVTTVGVRPTVSDDDRVSVESHLLDYSGNLYGRQARVEFYAFMRPERKFDSFEALSAQIREDASAARAYFEQKSC